MASLLAELIPTALLGAIAPLPIIVAITLLTSRGGLAKALSFGVALMGVFVVIGVISLTGVSAEDGTTDTGSAVSGTIIAVLGAVLMLMAVKLLFDAPDPDAPPPKFMARLDSMSPVGAAGFGAVVALINVKQLGIYLVGISQIINADVSEAQRWLALILLLLLIQVGLIGVILTYALARTWATRVLHRGQAWLVANNRVISIVLGLAVGAAFVVKGVTQIAG